MPFWIPLVAAAVGGAAALAALDNFLGGDDELDTPVDALVKDALAALVIEFELVALDPPETFAEALKQLEEYTTQITHKHLNAQQVQEDQVASTRKTIKRYQALLDRL